MAAVDLEEIKRLENAISCMETLQTASPTGVNSGLAVHIRDVKQRLQGLQEHVKVEEEKPRQKRQRRLRRLSSGNTAGFLLALGKDMVQSQNT